MSHKARQMRDPQVQEEHEWLVLQGQDMAAGRHARAGRDGCEDMVDRWERMLTPAYRFRPDNDRPPVSLDDRARSGPDPLSHLACQDVQDGQGDRTSTYQLCRGGHTFRLSCVGSPTQQRSVSQCGVFDFVSRV